VIHEVSDAKRNPVKTQLQYVTTAECLCQELIGEQLINNNLFIDVLYNCCIFDMNYNDKNTELAVKQLMLVNFYED